MSFAMFTIVVSVVTSAASACTHTPKSTQKRAQCTLKRDPCTLQRAKCTLQKTISCSLLLCLSSPALPTPTHTHTTHTHHDTPSAAHTNTPTMFANDLHSYTHATHVCEEARGGKNTPATRERAAREVSETEREQRTGEVCVYTCECEKEVCVIVCEKNSARVCEKARRSEIKQEQSARAHERIT